MSKDYVLPPGQTMPDDPKFEPLKNQHQRGINTVYEQNCQTFELAYATALSTVRLTAKERDVNSNSRLRYNRAWEACRKAAQQLSSHTSKPVPYPAWQAPPSAVDEDMVMAEPGTPAAPPVDLPPAKKIPSHITPGTAAWYRIQGVPVPEGVL